MTSYNTKQILEYATDSNFYTESGFNMWHSTNMPRIGQYTEYAFNNIAKNIQKKDPKDFLNTAKKSISSSYEIFSCCNPPYHSIFNPTQGLVVGRVQSGKTTSFSLVSAIAADNNYKIIIHFLGVNDTLLNDNFKSVKKNLGFDNKNLNWKTERIGDPAKKYQNETGLEQGKIKDLVSVLKSSKNKAPWQKKGETILYLYAYKLAPRINQAKKILEELQKHLKPGIPILIIDDEVDSYSVNTNKIVPGKDATATHAALSQLRAVAKNVTYIGYTATTAAIQFAHHTSFLRPQFHAVIDPGPGYVGNKEIFGEIDDVSTSAQRKKKIHDRHQSQKITVTKWNPALKNGKGDYEFCDKLLFGTLEKATADFLISWAFNTEMQAKKAGGFNNLVIGENYEPVSFMLNQSLANKDHKKCETDVKKILSRFASVAQNPNHKNFDWKFLKDEFKRKSKNLDKNFLKLNLTFTDVLNLINILFQNDQIKTQILNQKGTSVLDIETHAAWVLIGGLKLSRGYVVPNLITTWMPIQPKKLTVDVTQQRGRCFGYKKQFECLISVYTQSETENLYKNYSSVEPLMLEEFKSLAKSGISIDGCDPDQSLFNLVYEPTSSNKKRYSTKKKLKTKVHTSIFSALDHSKKTPSKNLLMENEILSFIKKTNLKKIDKPKVNKFQVSSSSQAFYFKEKMQLDDVYSNFLVKIKGLLDEEDKALKLLLNEIQSNQYFGKGHMCDIVFWPKIENRKIEPHIGNNNKLALQKKYWTGPVASQTGWRYVGDGRVLLGPNYDPHKLNSHGALEHDSEGNEHFTLQIHKILNVTLNQKQVLNDMYVINLITPWSKEKTYSVKK